VKELFDEAYRDLGYPNGDFDVALSKAIRVIDATPPAPSDMTLLRREGYFEHVDSTLGSLQPSRNNCCCSDRPTRRACSPGCVSLRPLSN
jgi:hypothetical protein